MADLLAPADLRRMEKQRPLVAAASAVRWEVEKRSYPGYAGIVLGESDVALWWKGALPATMRAVVARASRNAPVRVHAADYSMAELRTAAARVPAAGVQGIKFAPDGSGLIVSAAKASLSRLDVGVPVSVVAEAKLEPTSRDDDWAPWKGGATIVNTDQGTACTSGFGVRNGSASYILTAAHCGQAGQRFTDGRGEFIGTVGPRHQDHDVELVPTSSVDGYVYVGTPTDSVAAPVEGWGWTFVGEYLCQSGMTSARELGRPVCNLKVLFYYADREDLVEAEQTEGQAAARPGDSGGPIYSVAASGKILAKGTTTRTAGARIGFQDYGTAWRDFGGIVPATR
ncbi:S1 family peptidase [Actinoplanes bogorensis]|uniref:S1 family peptidase n=1 Tax=Paractinoplanes bogorensis TaxID=1610840 RepID=A0ABS5YMB7_9ACTN|nr:S1 family peptidase [Actinoplanes bogorensis]MBU2664577.1 S1 family peptidase [Actinoplanes bogorensis]